MKKIITICSSLILVVFFLGCSKDSTTAPTADRFTISIAESEKGIVDPHGDFTVQQADSINIKAKNSQDGYRFLKWQITNGSNNVSVRDTAGDSTYIASIAGDAEIEAVFARDTFDIVVTSDNNGDAANEGARKIAYMDSTQITVQSARSGWQFSHWSIIDNTNANIRDETAPTTWVVNVSGLTTVKANFTRINYDFTINQPDGGIITLENGQTPETTYPYGTVLRLKANPMRGYYLESWTDDASGYELNTTITVSENTTISADFREISVPADVICVDGRSTYSGSNIGGSWVRAYSNITTAIEALNISTTKTQVWVAGGDYSISTTMGLTLKANSKLYGGFCGYESSLVDRFFYKNPTILTSNGAVFLINLINAPQVVVDGVTIQNATYGINIADNTLGSQVISNCVFKHNNSYALRITANNVTVSNCVFRENENISGTGSALNVSGSGIKVSNSIFYNNTGSAIQDANPDPINISRYLNCTIYGNEAEDYPGGIYTDQANMGLYGCIIYGNKNANPAVATQISKVKNVNGCNIEDTITGVGIGERLAGTWQNVLDVDPLFPAAVTANDSLWFVPTVTISEGVLIPGLQELNDHATYQAYNPEKDIRDSTRTQPNFSVGAYEF